MKRKLYAIALAATFALSVVGSATADKPGPGEKQCRPGKQNPHCPSSPK
jgi:hypothetical protein